MTNITKERFEQGLRWEEFRAGMMQNREILEERYGNFHLEEDDIAWLQRMRRPLNVLVLLEEWCGDVLRYVPALARMSESAAHWNVRIFYRDQNLDLADNWLKEGRHRSIPVIVFLDSEMNELGCFIERPAAVYGDDAQGRAAFAHKHPDIPDAQKPSGEMSDATYNLYVEFARERRTFNTVRFQQMFVDEIKEKLAGVEQMAA